MRKRREQVGKAFRSLRWWHALSALMLVVLAVSIFFELAGDVWLKEGFAWDPPVMLFFGNLRSPIGTAVMRAVTTSASGWIVLPVLAATAWLIKRGDRQQAAILALGFLAAILLETSLKAAFARPRPHIIPRWWSNTRPAFRVVILLVLWCFMVISRCRPGTASAGPSPCWLAPGRKSSV